MTSLIITNGDQSADLIAAAGRKPPILPWRDALHEGPIPALQSLEAVSAVRAEHLADLFRLDPGAVAATFAERDEVMRRHAEFERIEFWFEHDLYDQLQLVQILDFFGAQGRIDGLVLVQADSFLAHERPDTILRFSRSAVPVDGTMLDQASLAWSALSAPTPERIAAKLDGFDSLPFLKPALYRFLEELPSPSSGLNRTETTMLHTVEAGDATPATLFAAMRDSEEAAFMGDWPFYAMLDGLAFCDFPLIEGLARRYAHGDQQEHIVYTTSRLELTQIGEDVLASAQDHVAANGIDRWWGGTHLSGFRAWRFDRDEGRLREPE